jgi:hypothetical protein
MAGVTLHKPKVKIYYIPSNNYWHSKVDGYHSHTDKNFYRLIEKLRKNTIISEAQAGKIIQEFESTYAKQGPVTF